MNVILTTDVEKLGSLGDEVKVKPGYARNFLLPKGLAMAITRQNIGRIQKQREKLALKRADAVEQAKVIKDKLEELELVFEMKAGENGKLFGSVSQKQILDAITENKIELGKNKLQLAAPLKTVGTHVVLIKLHTEIICELKVKIVPEKEVENPESENDQTDQTAAKAEEKASQ
ncbi:MAG: 50S ribosomal protein L9 [Deltaproteobacteria bacterium]|nr:50S ribosomal protein L9 [Deltaproteobacteria bacterium]